MTGQSVSMVREESSLHKLIICMDLSLVLEFDMMRLICLIAGANIEVIMN